MFTVPGALTARIRSFYGLNKILHNEDLAKDALSYEEVLKRGEELDKKNRKNKKHHALDAMCLCFAPTGVNSKRARIDMLLPPDIRGERKAELFFRKYLDRLIPVDVAPKKPRLEDGIYSMRAVGGKKFMARRVNLVDLAYKSGLKPVYDISALIKLLDKKEKGIINAQIRKLVADFARTNPSEDEWRKWCGECRLPSKNGIGTRVIRVLLNYGEPAEYKDLSKDGRGAFRRGDGHKGQIVWESTDGKYYVVPIYVHASKAKLLAELDANPKKKRVCDIFTSHCMVKIGNTYNDKGELLLPEGVYMVNTIWSIGQCVLTSANGDKSKPININYLMKAGMRKVSVKDL